MNQTTPLEFAVRQGAAAMMRFPSSSYGDKQRRALSAALHIAELKREFPTLTAVRLHLEGLFRVSERQIRRAEKILPYPEIVKLVLKGPVSVTNASHVIEHARIDMLRISWASAPEDARQEFRERLKKGGLV